MTSTGACSNQDSLGIYLYLSISFEFVNICSVASLLHYRTHNCFKCIRKWKCKCPWFESHLMLLLKAKGISSPLLGSSQQPFGLLTECMVNILKHLITFVCLNSSVRLDSQMFLFPWSFLTSWSHFVLFLILPNHQLNSLVRDFPHFLASIGFWILSKDLFFSNPDEARNSNFTQYLKDYCGCIKLWGHALQINNLKLHVGFNFLYNSH